MSRSAPLVALVLACCTRSSSPTLTEETPAIPEASAGPTPFPDTLADPLSVCNAMADSAWVSACETTDAGVPRAEEAHFHTPYGSGIVLALPSEFTYGVALGVFADGKATVMYQSSKRRLLVVVPRTMPGPQQLAVRAFVAKI